MAWDTRLKGDDAVAMFLVGEIVLVLTEATMLAVSKLEELRSSAAPVAGGDTVDARGQPPQGAVSRLFERRWSVAALSPDARILTVGVTLAPRGITGREVRITGGWIPTP